MFGEKLILLEEVNVICEAFACKLDVTFQITCFLC